MNKKPFFCLIISFISFIGLAVAQDTTRHDTAHHEITRRDTLRRDTLRPDSTRRRYFDTTLFSDNNILTSSDYLLHIQKVYQTLNKVPVVTESFDKLDDIAASLNESDTALGVIRERLSVNDRTLNLRNLQMFYTLLKPFRKVIKNMLLN